MKKRTSRKQVTKYLERKINSYHCGCKDRTHLVRAVDVIKDICKLKVYKNKLGQCFLEGTNILFPISQETYDLLKEVLL